MSITTVTGPKVDELLGAAPERNYATLDERDMLARTRPGAGEPTSSQAVAAPVSQPVESTLSVYQRGVENARRHFTGDYADAEMTVLHDASAETGEPYRHLRFRAKEHGFFHSFDIVTWPGSLTVTGGLDAYTFERLHDMMDFFRGRDINPSYWAEKCVSGTVRERFNLDAYREAHADQIEDLDHYSAADQAAIRAAVAEHLLDDPDSIEQAHTWAAQFEVDLPSGETFDFYDTWEWDFEAYDHHFLMACFAAFHGVNAYRTAHLDRISKEVTP